MSRTFSLGRWDIKFAFVIVAILAFLALGIETAQPGFAAHDPDTLPIDVDGWARTPSPTIALEAGYAANGGIYTQDSQTGNFAGTLFFAEDSSGSINDEGNYYFAFELSDLVNDNSYGAGSTDIWGNRGHRLSDLVKSEHAKVRIESADGNFVFDFDFDYAEGGEASQGQTVVGPIVSLGPTGGDGKVNEQISAVPFDPAIDMDWDTSLVWNINNVDDADGLGGNLTDSPALPFTDANPFTAGGIGFAGHSWVQELVYEWSVPNAVFGESGLGVIVVNNVTISDVHNSPFRDPDPAPIPILSVDKTADPVSGSEVLRNDTITFAVSGTNVGLTEINSLFITDQIDPSLAVVVATIFNGGTPSGQDGFGRGGTITWDIGTLAIGANITVTYDAVADPEAFPLTERLDIFNQATFTFVANTFQGTIDTPVTNHFILPEPNPTIAKSHIGAGPFAPGATVSYTVTVENIGAAPSTNTVVTDDPDETYVASVLNISNSGSYDGNVITWNLGALSPLAGPQALTYDVVLQPAEAGSFPEGTTNVDNTASVVSDQTGPDTANDSIAVEADSDAAA